MTRASSTADEVHKMMLAKPVRDDGREFRSRAREITFKDVIGPERLFHGRRGLDVRRRVDFSDTANHDRSIKNDPERTSRKGLSSRGAAIDLIREPAHHQRHHLWQF